MKSTLAQTGLHWPLGAGLWQKPKPHTAYAGRLRLPWGLLVSLLVADGLVWQHIPPGMLVLLWAGLSVAVITGRGCGQDWFKTLGFRDGVSRHSFKTSNTEVPL